MLEWVNQQRKTAEAYWPVLLNSRPMAAQCIRYCRMRLQKTRTALELVSDPFRTKRLPAYLTENKGKLSLLPQVGQ